MIVARFVETHDHHSEYLARAVAGLTSHGRERVRDLLEELAEGFADHPAVVSFAEERAAEADLGSIGTSSDAATDEMLSGEELEELRAGFTVIRDQEPMDDVADWANAVLALLSDEVHQRSPRPA
jgi:hypothetical protein